MMIRARGERVLHYRIGNRLGRGGMGVVYAAFDTRLERDVALKFLPDARSTDASTRRRVLHEARAAAALDHPNIGVVHALETTADGEPFIVMALYEGKTLEQRIVPLQWVEAVGVVTQVARALAHAHAAGVVHCDVKPGNVMVNRDGTVKLLDFGLATLKRPGALASGSLGTMEYMAPEHVRGEAPGPATDVWSLGVMLYELTTGVAPFRVRGGQAATILAVLHSTPMAPQDIDPSLPPALATVLARALARRIDERYASASELLAELERVSGAHAIGSPSSVPWFTPVAPPPHGAPTTNDAPPNNLESAASPLIGRDDERALLATYLADPTCRFVTIVGLGGSGKTRLAARAALDAVHDRTFAGGVYLVSLASCPSGEDVLAHVAQALGITFAPTGKARDDIARAIGAAPTLIVFDNVEHLAHDLSHAQGLLDTCPGLMLLATSSVRPDVAGGWVVPLAGLTVPERDDVAPEAAMTFGAVALFVECARRLRPDFSLTVSTTPHVLRLCRSVGGLPLALELAAPWLRALPLDALVEALDASLELLDTSDRSSARQRSLLAAFDRSWELLSGVQQALAQRLAVFDGGCTFAAAVEVADATPAGLGVLVDASIVTLTPSGRYQQHPLVRRYARARLAQHEREASAVAARHAAYFLAFLQRQADDLRTRDQGRALAAIEVERANVRAAWHECARRVAAGGAASLVGDGGPSTGSIGAASDAVRLFHDRRGLVVEGVALLRAMHEADPANGHVLVNLSWLTMLLGRHDAADTYATEGLARLDLDADLHALVTGWTTRGAVSSARGDDARAADHFRHALHLAQARSDGSLVARCLDNLASATESLGRLDEATSLYQRSLSVARRDGDDAQVAVNLNNLGTLWLHRGDPDQAEPVLVEGLATARRLGMERFVPYFLANLAECALQRGSLADAAATAGRALTHATEHGDRRLEVGMLTVLGRIHSAAGERHEATQRFAESLTAAREFTAPSLTLHALTYLAQHLLTGDPDHGTADLATRMLGCVVGHAGSQREDRAVAERLLSDRASSPRPLQDGALEELSVEALAHAAAASGTRTLTP